MAEPGPEGGASPSGEESPPGAGQLGGWQAARLVAAKELLEIVRDRRSLVVLLLLPILAYPVLLVGTLAASVAQLRRMAAEENVVWIDGLAAAPAGLIDRLSGEGPAPARAGRDRALPLRLTLRAPPPGLERADLDRALSEREVTAVVLGLPELQLDPSGETTARLEVLFNGGVDTSRLVLGAIEAAVRDWRDELVAERLRGAGLPATVLRPVEAAAIDRGAPGAVLGRMLAALLVMLSLTGAFYPALDLGAGEKERGTLETLLLAPVARTSLALGKCLAVFLVAAVCALLHILSLGLTFGSLALLVPNAAPELALEVPPILLPAMLVVLLPLVALFSALSLAIATFAASYKEGQAYLSPLMAAAFLPALAVALPGVELTVGLCFVPVVSAVLLMKGLLAQTVGMFEVALVVGSSLAYAALAVRWVASLYEREEVLWRPAAGAGLGLGALVVLLPRWAQGRAGASPAKS